MGGNVSKDINNFLTKDVKDAFNKIPKAFEKVGDDIKGAFEDVGDEIKGAFEDVGDTLKDFGLDVKAGVIGSIDVLEASFNYVEETGEFIGDLTISTFQFITGLLKQITRLIPHLLDVFQNAVKLLEIGFDISSIVIFILPALSVIYGIVYIIQILERKY
jgi:Flp pilus assembly pilin Flp